jgi:hypothetical protein
MFNAPSSSGKSYIPDEVSKLFPKANIWRIDRTTPTAFFHHPGSYDDETKSYKLDFRNKVLFFTDQPNPQVLEKLRPMLSHDGPDMVIQTADKTQKSGLRTKTTILTGHPAVIFCSAGMRLDEQELTRFIMLSPEVNREKVRAGIHHAAHSMSNPKAYRDELQASPERQDLKDRILGIKRERISDIVIRESEEVEQRFLAMVGATKQRHQRDIKRLISIIKVLALLNVWFRERKGSTLYASLADIEQGCAIWQNISASQELGVSQLTYDILENVIKPLYVEQNGIEVADKRTGVNAKAILSKFYSAYKTELRLNYLQKEVLASLSMQGQIIEQKDLEDRRRFTYIPVIAEEEYKVLLGGVTSPADDSIIDPFDH